LRYLQVAERTLSLFYPVLFRHASSGCSLLTVLEETLTPPQTIILRGQMPALAEWQDALLPIAPYAMMLALPAELVGLPVSLNKRVPPDNAVNAWVCQGVRCLPEISDLQELLRVCQVQGRIKFPL